MSVKTALTIRVTCSDGKGLEKTADCCLSKQVAGAFDD